MTILVFSGILSGCKFQREPSNLQSDSQVMNEIPEPVEEQLKEQEGVMGLPGPGGLGGGMEVDNVIIEGPIDEKKCEVFKKSMEENQILSGERPYDFSFEYPSACRVDSGREGVYVHCPDKKDITIIGPRTHDMEFYSREVILGSAKREPPAGQKPPGIIDENYHTPTLEGIIYKTFDGLTSAPDDVFTNLWDKDNTFMVNIYLKAKLYDQDSQFRVIYQHLVESIKVSVGPVKPKE